MPKNIDFLTPNTTQIRHQIRNIIESYNHDWDVIAELAQNSVDAITVEQPVKGHMRLEIDSLNKRIEFKDNGCGISPSALPLLLAPFSSDKGQSPDLIGYKGVGVSFVIFSSAQFDIESHHADGSSRATISGAQAWLSATTEQLPALTVEEIAESSERGTRISIQLPAQSEHDLFHRTIDQLEMVLRTRTAIGDTGTIWGANVDKDLLLIFRDLDGQVHKRQIDCSYFLPVSKLRSGQSISLRSFQEWNTGDRTDPQKRRKLKNKVIFHSDQITKSGRTIRFWACFVPKRQVWDQVSVNSGLIDREILDLTPTERIEVYADADYLFSGGLYTSSKGMPTGIRSEMRAKGSAGYLPNFFVIVDDPALTFDIGRKSIPSRTLGLLRDVASDVFRDFLKGIRRYIGGEPDVTTDVWDKSRAFNEIRRLPNLGSAKTRFLKRPSNQEATIAAVFFEMIGNGTIEDLEPYICGYKEKYDLYARYKNMDIVIEFKYRLAALFHDFDQEVKLFNEIDVVVVWEITEADYEVVNTRGADIEEVELGLTASNHSIFHYNLILGQAKPIPIVCLRKLI